jgi:hypothetical protein
MNALGLLLTPHDKVMMAMLQPLGIEKGRPFQPGEREKHNLTEGATLGELMARNLQVNQTNLSSTAAGCCRIPAD